MAAVVLLTTVNPDVIDDAWAFFFATGTQASPWLLLRFV